MPDRVQQLTTDSRPPPTNASSIVHRPSSIVRLVLVGAAVLGVLLPAWGWQALSGSGGAGRTITFGATISITGKTAKEGEYARDGYQFFVDSINERGGITVGGTPYQVKLRYYDDESDPTRAALLYERLITEDRIDFLLGPYGSGPTDAVAAVAEKYQIPLVVGHGSAGSIYAKGRRYVLGIQTPARNYLRGVIAAIRAHDPTARTLAMLIEDDPFSQEVAAGALAYAQEQRLQAVYTMTYPLNTGDVSLLLTAIKDLHPDILLGSGHLQDSLLIARQVHALGVAPKALGFTVGPVTPEFRRALKAEADYILGPTQWTATLVYEGSDPWRTPAAFAAAFQARYPHYQSVPYQVAESVAAGVVYQQALEKAGTLDRQRMRETLAGLDILTFFGPIRFDAQGVNSSKPMAVVQLQRDGKTVIVFPPEVAEAELVYPMPGWEQR